MRGRERGAVRWRRAVRWRQKVSAVGLLAAIAGPGIAHAQYRGDLSTLVVDARTGNVLQQTGADVERFPASLTKLMTLYLTFEAVRDRRVTLDQAVPVSAYAASVEPSKLGLQPGSYITVEEAILALVTKSANDAATALGELLGGDEQRFGQMMTLRARALGMEQTTFRNASGLPDPDQMTTANDLALLARHLISDFPEDYHYFSVPDFWFHGRMIPNHDPMLRSYPGADGLKTGFTDAAGCNLVTSAMRGNVRLVGVVLGASNNVQRSAVMTALLNQGFAGEGVPIPAPVPSFGGPRRHPREPMLVADTLPAGGFATRAIDEDGDMSWRRHRLVRRVLALAAPSRRGRHALRMDAASADTAIHAGMRRGAHRHALHRTVVDRGHRRHAAVIDDALLGRPGSAVPIELT